jgi:outer membrane receptor protein involved in Fe transport
MFILFLLFSATLAFAQTGTISGKVTDDEGQPLPGALVEIAGTALRATANEAGEFTIDDIPAGPHRVEVTAYSYGTESADVTVNAGQTVTQDFSLRLSLLNMEEIVVTGTTHAERKIESSNTISTLTTEEIQEAAPRSTTEFLRRIPGFTRVESSGGEVNQNISVRGFLGVETVNFQEDGMPVYPTMHVFFMNADNLIRPDLNISEIEVVRGSDSPIFGSSASAAIVNFINKTGGDELHGAVMGQGGEGGLARFDFNMNGPLTDEWRFNVGGFYRYDHGIRDPSYPGTKGGMLKANVTRLLDNGFFRVSAKYIQDQNLFILPLPFQNPGDPDYINGFPSDGSYTTKEGVNAEVPLPTGDDLVLPLDEGINTTGGWVTGHVNVTFGDDWNFEDIAQGMSVDHQWNAIAPGSPIFANDYVAGIIGGLVNDGIVPVGSTGQLFFTNHRDINGNKLPFDTPNGLVAPSSQFHVEKPITSFSNMITVRKTAGRHKIAFGNYFAYYTQDNLWYFPNILMDIRGNPRYLDLVITTPSGEQVDYTKNGFRNFLSTFVNAHGNNTLVAIYGNDEILITDRLRIDVGLRYEHQNYFQVAENTSNFDLDGDPRTVYDIEQFGNQTFRQFDFNIDDIAYSAGFNYQLKPDQLAIYGSFTHGFWMPALDEFMFEQRQELVELFEPRKTNMIEGGVKYSGREFGLTGTLYYGELKNVISRGVEFDLAGNPVFVTRPSPDTSGWGLEFEFLTRPLTGFEIRTAATLVNIEAPAGAQAQSRYDGLTPAIIDLELAYEVYQNARLSLDWHYVGERFTDPAETVKLESYGYFNLGASYTWPLSGITIGARVLNLNNSHGFEEGDPRNDPNRGAAQNLFNARPLLPRRFLVEARYDW